MMYFKFASSYKLIKYMHTYIKPSYLLFILAYSTCIRSHSETTNGEEITVMTGGFSYAMQVYHKQILTRILDLSQEKYGKLNIKYYDKDLTPKRGYRETSKGRLVHIGVSTEKPKGLQQDLDFSSIQIPIYNGIHGLRKVVIRSGDESKFSNIESEKQFTSLRVGQGTHWPDIESFESSGILIKEAVHFSSLFSMLERNRFDYISLGIVEADTALEREKQLKGKLSVMDDIFIYYALPIYLNITNNKKNLKDRISYGKNILIQSGELETLFNTHFGHIIKRIPKNTSKVFILRNPNLSDLENLDSINKALSYYFSPDTKIYNLSELNIRK